MLAEAEVEGEDVGVVAGGGEGEVLREGGVGVCEGAAEDAGWERRS